MCYPQTGLCVKKKSQNKHSHGSRSRAKQLTYDHDFWGGWHSPPPRNKQWKRSAYIKFATQVKNEALRKCYHQWIDYESMNFEQHYYEIFDNIDKSQLNNDKSVGRSKIQCRNCGYFNQDGSQFCPICNLSFDEPLYSKYQTQLRLFGDNATKEYLESIQSYINCSKTQHVQISLKEMNISRKGKYKIAKYKMLQTHFMPLLHQLHPTYFIYGHGYRSEKKLYHTVKISDGRKYSMKKTEIKCIVPEYMLQRLQAMYGLNKSFEPQIVYTTQEFMMDRWWKKDLVTGMKMNILENNSFIQYHFRINKVIYLDLLNVILIDV